MTQPPMPSALLIVSRGAPFRIRAGTDIETAGCNVAGPIDRGDLAGDAGYFDQARFGHALASRPLPAVRFFHKSDSSRHATLGRPQAEEVLVGTVNRSTANGDTRSGLRLRVRIAVPGRAAGADPARHLARGTLNSRSLPTRRPPSNPR